MNYTAASREVLNMSEGHVRLFSEGDGVWTRGAMSEVARRVPGIKEVRAL